MIAEISAGLSGLKAAKDVLHALHGVQTAVAINEVKFALQSHLLDAQQGLFAAQEAQSASSKRIADLEQQIVNLKNWECEKQRYELKKYYPGALTYTLKAGVEGCEPPHHLCANCYQKGEKSILQGTAETQMRYRVHLCPSCKTKTVLGSEMETGASEREPPPTTRGVLPGRQRSDGM